MFNYQDETEAILCEVNFDKKEKETKYIEKVFKDTSSLN